jgi:hypothetical protein
MPRFFFHVRNGGGDIGHDTEGQELPDLGAARREAVNTNREMLGEKLLHGGLHHRHIEIANENGEVLAMVNASEVVLAKDGQLRSFQDDVTKSAPMPEPGDTLSKSPSR